MTIKKRTTAGLTTADPVALPTLGLGATFAQLIAIRARNYASSAKAAAGADTAGKIKITDGVSGDVVYLDAASRDYATSPGFTLYVARDDTATGLTATTVPVDATGAALAANVVVPILLSSPVIVTAVGFGTTTDYLEVSLFVEV